MKHTVLFLLSSAAILTLAGCEGASTNSATTSGTASVMDVNSNLPFQGHQITNDQSADCSQFVRDADLRKNDSEIREIKANVDGELMTTTLKSTYLGDDSEQKSHLSTKILSISGQSNGEYLKSAFEYQSTCSSTDDSKEDTCMSDRNDRAITEEMQSHANVRGSMLLRAQRQFQKCEMGSNENSSTIYQSGNYTLRSGQVVTALRKTSQVEGVIICNGQRVGHGTMILDQVSTHDVISVSQRLACGEAEIYSGSTFRTDDGKVVSSRRSEVVEASKR